jgi:hypothetical protein
MHARKLFAIVALIGFIAPAAKAAPPPVPGAPAQIDRSADPVVLTGQSFPSWSAGPDPTLKEPAVPHNYDVADIEQVLQPVGLGSDCYKKTEHPNPYDYSDNGDHNCYQSSRLPANPNTGADVHRILGYRWEGGKFVEIPLQVDERFTRYISNHYSGFAFYSGVDQETTYAWDREGFRYTWDNFSRGIGDRNPCTAQPAPGSTMVNGRATTLDPVKGLDDNDEIAFMYADSGAQAPTGTALPAGIDSSYEITLNDPTKSGAQTYVYAMLAKPETAGGPSQASINQWNDAHSYVRYVRDANADTFAYSQSSYGNYGNQFKGPYCNPDGSVSTTYYNYNDDGTPAKPAHGISVDSADPAVKSWAIEQRRPLDTAWVKTPRYWFRYDGRWLMTELRVSTNENGLTAMSPDEVGPDIIDQWKARAFQQRPGDPDDPAGGTTPCCGYEEEVNNWGGSSTLFGERTGPVRAIRASWGADSSTNNIKTETFYRDDIRFADELRVHVIPPADGIYVQWDYNAGKVSTYYNPFKPEGVAIDGQNDEVFGNTKVHIAGDRVEVEDPDPVPGTADTNGDGKPDGIDVNTQAVTPTLIPGSNPSECKIQGNDSVTVCNDLDFTDPTFSGPSGVLNWEEVAGPNGSLVTRWTIKQHSAGDAYSLIAQPYYRDDSCFDDGTGTNPGPHLRKRDPDSGSYSYWTDPATGIKQKRVCWKPGDVLTGDPRLDAKYVQGDIATHGLHLQLIADSDNADQTQPIDEVDSEQRMVVLPRDPGNVGERFGRNTVEFAIQTVARPYV